MSYAFRSVNLNNIDLNKLHAFGVVAAQGGVGSAASILGRTPSAVSQSVSGLERALGVKLFDRVGKRLVLTRGGQLLAAHLRDYQGALQRTVEELVNSAGEVRGQVRVGVYLGFPRLRLAAFLTAFTRRHPLVRVRVVYAPQEDLHARLLRNRLDVVLALRPTADSNPRIASTTLFEEALVLVAHRRRFPRGFNRAALATTPIVDYYQSDPLIARWIAHHLDDHSLRPEVVIWAATTDLVLDLVLQDAGAAVLPRTVAAPALRARRLVELRTRRPPLTDAIWLNELRDAYRDRTLSVFRAAVMREFA
jgi:DNA-binding transcriptional LysR family regulator